MIRILAQLLTNGAFKLSLRIQVWVYVVNLNQFIASFLYLLCLRFSSDCFIAGKTVLINVSWT